ncbi:MAG TPA: M18 family aminopeptidase [Lachnospiraceae bacterium]|nr:M18 family aminopeptidase [Lachnospiraceae bacterium]
MKEYRKYAEEMLEFIEKSPTAFHAVANLMAAMAERGFRPLEEKAAWKLAAGEGYYVTRNDSSLIAFRLPASGKAAGFHIAASHGDSPTFKVKEAPEMVAENAYVKLNTEKYGGMILSSWLDRPLSVAGRVVVQGEKGIETRLINIDEDLMVIPSLAIHMSRDTPAKGEYNPQVDMLPLYGACDGEKGSDVGKHMFLERVARTVGTEANQILGHDLFLYIREKGRILGENGDFVLSSRLDDLQCAYTSARAFLESTPEEYINVCVVFDNEEVGSGTKQGANSTFLEDVLWRIGESMGLSKSEYLQLIAGSFLISADNAHAVHPNHPEKADPTNRPLLNGGIVLKFQGSQKYATDAVSAAVVRTLCQEAGVPCQTYANRSDIAGGSTLGNISTAHVSVSSADIGLPQLAMHSAVETAGVKDTKYAVDMFRIFFAG